MSMYLRAQELEYYRDMFSKAEHTYFSQNIIYDTRITPDTSVRKVWELPI